MDGDTPPVPEPPIQREASGASRIASDAPRRKTRNVPPPPPPGSAARKGVEDEILELREVGAELDEAPRPPAVPAGGRPPVPPRPRTGPAPLAGKPRAPRGGEPLDLTSVPEADKTKENRGAVGIKSDRNASLTANTASGTIGGDTPHPIFDRAAILAGPRGALAGRRAGDRPQVPGDGPAGAGPPRTPDGSPLPIDDHGVPRIDPGAMPHLAPVGEIGHGQAVRDPDHLRIAHAPAADERAGGTAPRVRGDSTLDDASGSSTGRFERGDPTIGDGRGDATAIAAPASGHVPTGTLRSSAALPRRRGIAGDLRYVATVVLGVREARRELAALAARQATRQQSRRHHLVTLGRAAVTADGFDHPALGAAREQLASVEDERSQHAGHVVAADAELTRVRRDREAKVTQYAADLAAVIDELAAVARQLEPLDKEAAGIRKRGADLHDALRRIDGKIAATEASLGAVRGGKLDRAEIQAELATLKAERRAIRGDEPAIAGQLDALNPRIAALEAARAEAGRKRAELEAAEQDDQRRVEELLAAIGAKRKVVDRAAAAAEARRDKILFQLGERLYVDRPGDLTAELAPIDEIDLELGSADRRMMELREIVASVDRWKLARGVAVIAVLVAALGALAGWLILHQPWRPA